MELSAYSPEEIKEFEGILSSALAETLVTGIHIPISVMALRLFSAVRGGERDPERLKKIALGADVVQEFPLRRGPRASRHPAA